MKLATKKAATKAETPLDEATRTPGNFEGIAGVDIPGEFYKAFLGIVLDFSGGSISRDKARDHISKLCKNVEAVLPDKEPARRHAKEAIVTKLGSEAGLLRSCLTSLIGDVSL